MTHFQVLVVGGGNAGLSITSKLLLKDSKLNIGIIEPSEKHYYQPAWTLVGGGVYNVKDTEKNERDFIPKGSTWVKDSVSTFEPDQNQVTCKSGAKYTYDYLIVVPGIQLNWHKVKGLKETLGKNGVTSNYSFNLAPYTYECIKNFKGGNALFTSPNTPVKCGGAPQKIMYLASDNFRKRGILKGSNVHFFNGGTMLFGVKKYAEVLQKIVNRYGIKEHHKHNLVEIDGDRKLAWFETPEGQRVEQAFDMIHVVPPQSAPDFVKYSPLAIQDPTLEAGTPCTPSTASPNFGGWVDVDKYTLQHNRYPNVFSCGDVANTPNAKTGAAVRKQAPVLVDNLMHVMKGGSLSAKYNGYGSCPLTTGYGKLVLAEFDYDNQPTETFPFNQAKERWSMWMLKTKVLPWMYWNRILQGKA
ncbi:MAG: NAD(P)/FAD-dependent oxidoreductase [Saprospiraceae bacterium]|nr:NAD(P)/FAD-dependent oxidoreductase [Saprospiraceae bacterium]